jgi:hypothetical protein
MPFDPGIASKALSVFGSDDPLTQLGSSFGVPACMIDIGKSVAAQLLPSNFLALLAAAINKGKQAANDYIAALKAQLFRDLGIRQDFNKQLTSLFGVTSPAAKLASIAGTIGAIAGTGVAITANLQAIEAEINSIKECLNLFSAYQKLNESSVAVEANADPDYINAKYSTVVAQLEEAYGFIDSANDALNNINQTLYNRTLDPELEPIYLDPNLSAFGAVAPTPQTDPVFRLVFGPPKSKKGQFLLSIDGLYYDAQNGGVPNITGFVLPENRYKFEFPSNLGGKGSIVSLKDLNTYVDTIFDLDKVDASPAIQEHYTADHFLQILVGQRDKHVYDASAKIQETIDAGNSEDSAIVINMQESLNSIVAHHEAKINRRKKQIEVAIKSPYLAGTNPGFGLGQVPINDFSYLKDLNFSVAFEKQKKLIFQQGEVSGVVLPVRPKFVKAQDAKNVSTPQHLIVPVVGLGSIIYDNDGIQQQGTVLSLNDSVVKTGLLAIYNMLQGEVVNGGSTEYKVINCASSGNNIDNAQLVGLSASGAFPRGLAIPFLTGMTRLTAAGNMAGFGNYLRLPNTPTFQNLAYKKSGFSVESWVYLPYAGSAATTVNSTDGYGLSSYHRLLLACENTGGIDYGEDPFKTPFSNSSDFVKGLVLGFTRDRQVTQNLVPSNNNTDNPASAGVFYVAPTRSVNASNVGFVNKASTDACPNEYEILKFAVPLSATIPGTNKKLFDVSSQFMHFALSLDPNLDSISLFVDGVLVKTDVLSKTFNTQVGSNLNIPTFAKDNSFSYSVNSPGMASINYGPVVPAGGFTPWIVGGGFTDAYKPNLGDGSLGFMGTGHGLNSGLNGYVGSLKFYSKPLTSSEVLFNYDSQKGFFKNIDLT